ncbi:MAG: zinc-ribbon domain-containing protein [Clostridia bacterium]|nr:zinc-ribbon domain-containing protein [Clostridia bacterium]
MFCSNCGTQLPENAKFCHGCGSAITTIPVQPVQSAPVQPAPAHQEPAYQQPLPSQAPQPSAQPSPYGTYTHPYESPYSDYDDDDDSDGSKKKKVSKAGIIIGTIFTLLFAGVFVFCLITTLNGTDKTGNILLLVSGLVEAISAFIMWKVIRYRERYICPECGTKRVHHRAWDGTNEKYEEYSNHSRITYTHIYIDTYECPKCYETLTERVKKSGGNLTEYEDTGRIVDNRVDVREF